PVELATLDHVMHHVAGDDGALSPREDVDTAMARRVPGRRRQRDGVVERVVVVDQERLAGLDDRQTVIAEHLAKELLPIIALLPKTVLVLFLPPRVLPLVKDV